MDNIVFNYLEIYMCAIAGISSIGCPIIHGLSFRNIFTDLACAMDFAFDGYCLCLDIIVFYYYLPFVVYLYLLEQFSLFLIPLIFSV